MTGNLLRGDAATVCHKISLNFYTFSSSTVKDKSRPLKPFQAADGAAIQRGVKENALRNNYQQRVFFYKSRDEKIHAGRAACCGYF